MENKKSYYQKTKEKHFKEVQKLNETIKILIENPDSTEAINIRINHGLQKQMVKFQQQKEEAFLFGYGKHL